MTAHLPRIAVVGRPNVGKSTLFNRLAGKPLAIVDDRPGVTRDRREARGRLGDLPLLLIDTAGYDDAEKDGLDAEMRTQTEMAIHDADLCLLLIDARAGVTPLDEVFADVIRRSGKPVLLLANKCEGKAGESGLMDAYELGMGEPIAMSAAHGAGIGDLYDAVFAALGPMAKAARRASKDEGDPPLRIAVIGRPNAGKSTLINTLIGEERLITGPEAGITRDAISVDWVWDGRRVRLHDTAGLRRRGKVADRLERMSAADTLRAVKFAEVVVLLMDAEHPLEKQDLHLADMAYKEGRAVAICVSKMDLVPHREAYLKEIRLEFERLLPQMTGAPLLPISALKKKGLDAIMPTLAKLHENWDAKVKTRDLNDWLHEMTERHPPPAVNGRRIKPRYITQTKGRPPTFVMMCSRASDLPESYKRYLVNGLRDAFDLPGVPIRLIVKAGKNPYVEGDRGGSGPGDKASKTAKPARPNRPVKPPKGQHQAKGKAAGRKP
ncbi:ribosome biogenesis GTPase Der [uncultured Maricaulis sp.]|uniref:ribosome biogenesis GTPase Der n=1 Tax=uncultured Maricaulis sp. TaxID=174710 RepID=UPI00260FD09D|nr:ribosome biogenesis GTPase Der [uncultured Maricaulis sp.]